MIFAILDSDRIFRILSGDITRFPGAAPLPDDFRGVVGMHRDEFRDDWTIRLLSERVAAGYVQTPRGYKLDGEQFVALTQTERYREGLDEIPDGMVLEGETLRPMTRVEQVAAGKLTQAEAKASIVSEVHALREERFRNGFTHTDGYQYPLDLGAQAAFLGIDALVAKRIPVPINIVTVDNQIVPMTVDEFSAFSLAAFAAANDIVFLAREAKDRILAAETIEAAEAVAEAYKKG